MGLSKIKVGVVGCGAIAKRAHMPAYRALGLDILGVADLDLERAKKCASRFGAKKYFADYHDLLALKPDILSICTPNDTHARIGIEAAREGINILIEKPMATNTADAERLLKIAKESGVKLGVVQNFRLFPAVTDAKNRITQQRIGNLVSIHAIGRPNFTMRWSDSAWYYSKWGLLEDVGVHLLDIISHLVNSDCEKANVVARDILGTTGFVNHIHALLSFSNGVTSDLDLCWIAGSFETSLHIYGTAGSLYLDVRNNHLSEKHGFSTPIDELSDTLKKCFRVTASAFAKTYFKGAIHYHRAIIEDFVRSVLNDSDPLVTGEEALKTVRLIDLIKQSDLLVTETQQP